MMIFVALLVVHGLFIQVNPARLDRKNNEIIENIRRQLTSNNYDYTAEVTKVHKIKNKTPSTHKMHVPESLKRLGEGDEWLREDDDPVDATYEVMKDMKSHEKSKKNASESKEGSNSVDELIENTFVTGVFRRNEESGKNTEDNKQKTTAKVIKETFSITKTSAKPKPTAKYKLIEIHSKAGKSGRRSLSRRLIEEEAPGHVAIIPLDEGPLPPFQLPSSRRQYMSSGKHEVDLS